MADNPTKAALYELLDYLEQVETKCGALMAFFRANGTLTDETLAPYLEQADNATDIKSRAIRARFDYLFPDEQTVVAATDANPLMPNERASEESDWQANEPERNSEAA